MQGYHREGRSVNCLFWIRSRLAQKEAVAAVLERSGLSQRFAEAIPMPFVSRKEVCHCHGEQPARDIEVLRKAEEAVEAWTRAFWVKQGRKACHA